MFRLCLCPAGVLSASATAVAEHSGGGANHDQMFADEDEEGWEDMHDLTPAHKASATAVAEEGDDAEGWEEPEDLATAETAADATSATAVAEGDATAEGWEEAEDLAPAEATSEATSDVAEGDAATEEAAPSDETGALAAAAEEPEAAHQVGYAEPSTTANVQNLDHMLHMAIYTSRSYVKPDQMLHIAVSPT